MLRQTSITEYFYLIGKRVSKKRKFYKQSSITKYLRYKVDNKKVYGFNQKTNSWHCTECGIDMGYCNPRQLCGKIFCSNIF